MLDRISLMTFPMDIDVMMKKMIMKDIFDITKENGINYIDVMNLSEDKLNKYINISNEVGIKTYCYIGSVSFFSRKENEIIEELKKQINIAKKLESKLYMIVPVNPQKDEKICEKLGKQKVQELLIKYFNIAVSLAKDVNLKVCFETTPQDYTCLSGIDDCKYILDNVEDLGLVYDTANMLPHGDDSLAYYNELKSYIVHTHFKDVKLAKRTFKDKLFHAEQTKTGEVMKCCITGQGVIPLKNIYNQMKEDGYQGYFALEYSHPEKYPATKEQNLERLKEHMDYIENLE